MRPRFSADYRTLFWAFLFFPAIPALGLIEPALLWYLTVPAAYASYCAGILAHNHNHHPVFRSGRANAVYGSWLSIFYGFPVIGWIPVHNNNHHRYLNGDGDLTRTTRFGAADNAAAVLLYPLRSARFQAAEVASYFLNAPGRRRRFVLQVAIMLSVHLVLLAVALGRHGARGALVYGITAGLPALLAPYWMMLTNYLQHVGCDPSSTHDHSRNFVSPFFNWFVFDNGYHTVHHEHPTAHWSQYRALHRARAHAVDPALNQRSIVWFCIDRYLLRTRPVRAPAT